MLRRCQCPPGTATKISYTGMGPSLPQFFDDQRLIQVKKRCVFEVVVIVRRDFLTLKILLCSRRNAGRKLPFGRI